MNLQDFGEALVKCSLNNGFPTIQLLGCQRLHEMNLFLSRETWTLACIIWDVFGSGPPLEAFPARLDDSVTIGLVEILGKLPDRRWNMWEERGN